LALFSRLGADAAEPDPLVARWLASATNLTSWTAGFTQTRHLKALTQPLTTTGQVWFAAPARFRWELGQPAQSIVLREGDELLVLSPRLKRAERYHLAASAPGPLRDALALLDTGFPRSAAEFHGRFDLLGLVTNENSYGFRLRPRAAAARRLLPELRLEADRNDLHLTATELTFADGSRLRNDFTNAVANQPPAVALFTTNLDASWKLSPPPTAK
jgi:outer membrane lipoprotein-sorting protein